MNNILKFEPAAPTAVAPAAVPLPTSQAAGAPFPRTIQDRASFAARRSEAMNDWAVIDTMKRLLRQHLTAGLLECAATMRDLQMIDADQLMVELRKNFDAENPDSSIQDAFSDAFHDAMGAVMNAGGEPVSSRIVAPSGVTVGWRE